MALTTSPTAAPAAADEGITRRCLSGCDTSPVEGRAYCPACVERFNARWSGNQGRPARVVDYVPVGHNTGSLSVTSNPQRRTLDYWLARDEWIDRATYIPPARLPYATQLVNAFDKGVNPFAHEDGMIWLGDDQVIRVMRGTVPAKARPRYLEADGTERLGDVEEVPRWYLFRCHRANVSGREMARISGRTVPLANRRGTASYMALYPEEVIDGGWVGWEAGDDAVDAARGWASEIRAHWQMELEGYGESPDIVVDPERALYLAGLRKAEGHVDEIEATIERLSR